MHQVWPLELLTVMIFVEQKGKTEFTIQWVPINATEEECRTFDTSRDSMKQGCTGSLDQLTEYLAKG